LNILTSNALAILIFILSAENGQYEPEIDTDVESSPYERKKGLVTVGCSDEEES
jgi:hypothetical protein